MEYFTNPYNFVPFTGTCKRGALTLGPKECRTGYFDCELELLTPLFIPNTSNKSALCNEEERIKKYTGYEFCSYEDLSGDTRLGKAGPKDPVIPGSEIRGAVRSVYEAAFGGCMSTMRVDGALGRRNPSPKRPGIMEREGKNGWYLYPCERAMLNAGPTREGQKMPVEVYASLKEGQLLWIKLSENRYKNRNYMDKVVERYKIPDGGRIPDGYCQAWFHKGEPFGKKKHHESVFYCKNEERKMLVPEEEYRAYQQVMDKYKDGKAYSASPIDENRVLVYYVNQNGVPRNLSPACIGNEIFQKTFRKILESNGGFQPCVDMSELCPACKIFGMVSDGNGTKGAVCSRVRFADACLGGTLGSENVEDYYGPCVVLPEAGEPRPSAVEFYTESPYKDKDKGGWKTEGYWTYDYMFVKRKGKEVRELLEESLPELRGRKFYWHHDGWEKLEKNNPLDGEMKQRIWPLLPDHMAKRERKFIFRVYFDKLNWDELGRLRWSLDFMDPICAHKIGRGKPYGLGSVRIHINNLKIRELDANTGRVELTELCYENLGHNIAEDSEAVKTLKIMAAAEPLRHDVSYPRIDGNKTESFRWFVNNRTRKETTTLQPTFSKILPKAEEELDSQNICGKRLHT